MIYDVCVIGSGAGAGPIIYELRKKESANKKVGYFQDIACTFIFIVLK